ncbi:MAG TPA: dihydroorotate dehydrogenase electron transfer subunit, partial [Dictyoglomaceae bacterium]|nr:dihydroorotate dehydrogenase electron transfer subunit [Dictyoglomaceae bacterium]
MKEFIGEILENRNLNNKIFLLKVKVNMRDCIIYPGQFAMLLISDTFDPFLRRPMSFYDVSENLIEFLYQIVGRGTELLSKKEKGEKISFIAPLGNYFPLLKEGEKILLVGGGMGISPLNFLIDFYRNKIDFYSFLGFSSYIQKEVYENFSKYSKEMIISTEDGSLGYKGKILDFIPEDL